MTNDIWDLPRPEFGVVHLLAQLSDAQEDCSGLTTSANAPSDLSFRALNTLSPTLPNAVPDSCATYIPTSLRPFPSAYTSAISSASSAMGERDVWWWIKGMASSMMVSEPEARARKTPRTEDERWRAAWRSGRV